MWLVCGRALLTVAILGLVTVLMYYVAERVHEVETTIVPLPYNETLRLEYHNRTVIRGSRSKRSSALARKFDRFFGLFPATEAVLVAPSFAWDRESLKSNKNEIEKKKIRIGEELVREREDRETIELPNAEPGKEEVQENRRKRSSITGTDSDRSTDSVIDRSKAKADPLLGRWLLKRTSSLDADELPLKGSRTSAVVGIPTSTSTHDEGETSVPKIDRNLFEGGGGGEETVTADQPQSSAANDDLPEKEEEAEEAEEPSFGATESKSRPQRYVREDVSYVFLPDCVTEPHKGLVVPQKYPLPGHFYQPHRGQDYRDQGTRKWRDHGRYSML